MPHMTVEVFRKLVPATVSVKGAEPAAAFAGDSEAMVGLLSARLEAADVAPLAFFTVMLSGPAVASRAAVTVAVMEVVVPAVTVNAVEPA